MNYIQEEETKENVDNDECVETKINFVRAKSIMKSIACKDVPATEDNSDAWIQRTREMELRTQNDSITSLADVDKVCDLGRGGFGRVWKVKQANNTATIFAMKEMSKARVIKKKSVKNIMNELKLMCLV